jgi:hypothetical protein
MAQSRTLVYTKLPIYEAEYEPLRRELETAHEHTRRSIAAENHQSRTVVSQ